MDETVDQTALVLVVAATVVAIVLTFTTWWRVRSPALRRDRWLSANAQPRLTRLVHALAAVFSSLLGFACVLGAVAGYAFLWAPVPLIGGLLVSTIISGVIALKPPADLD